MHVNRFRVDLCRVNIYRIDCIHLYLYPVYIYIESDPCIYSMHVNAVDVESAFVE